MDLVSVPVDRNLHNRPVPGKRGRDRLSGEATLLESQIEQINRFPDQNPNPVMRMTEDGVLLYANTASAPIITALGIAVGDLLPEETLAQLRRAAADPAAPPVEIVTNHRTYAVLCVPVPEFGFLNLYGTDITAEKVVARFPDQNPNPVFRATMDGRLLYANTASAEVVRAIGVSVGDPLPEAVFERIRGLADGSTTEGYEIRTDDGRTFVLTPVWIPEFEFINVYGTDVTGEKVVARFPDENPNPVLRTNGEGRLLYANAASAPLLRLFGCVIGQKLPPRIRKRIVQAASGNAGETLEVESEGRAYVLKPVWVREFEFINVYGTDVTAARELEIAHEEVERLLLNILPEPIARRLRQGERVIADRFDDVTLLFADIVGFTQLSSGLQAAELVEILNSVFSAFDGLVGRYGLEKIKTIGDAYMVVGGLPEQMEDHTARVADMALELRDEIGRISSGAGSDISFRVGMSVGPVVAGVIGVTKFIYDVWGDTVNTASRMESHGLPDRIHVTHSVYERLRGRYLFEPRGIIEVKGKGPMQTYFLLGRAEAARPAGLGAEAGRATEDRASDVSLRKPLRGGSPTSGSERRSQASRGSGSPAR
jgi:class 3 adenylate cyclase/PAS domain-containing protein